MPRYRRTTRQRGWGAGGRGAGRCGRAGAGARGSPGPSLWGSTVEAPAHCACACAPSPATAGLRIARAGGATRGLGDPSCQTAVTVQSWHHRTWASPSTHTCPPHMRLRNSTQDQRRRTGPPRCPAMMQPPQDPPVATPAAYAGAAAAAVPGTKNGSELGRLLGKASCNPYPAVKFEYSEENMLFWLACEELKAEANQHVVDEKARLIYEDYVSILSPKEVSLDSRVREGINRKMQEPSPHTFDDAQLQIYTLMHRDSYPRFLTSPAYRSLLLQGAPRSSSEA